MLKNRCPICVLTAILIIVGALNWGLVGLLNFNLVTQLVGNWPNVERGVYILVGLAGLVKLIGCFKDCPCMCKKA